MQTRNPIMDDISRMMQGAAGMAQAANDEAKALFRSAAQRVVADMDLAKREEVEALKALARSAVERADALEKRVAELSALGRFDIIFCAEVLMYVREKDAASACQVLDAHLGEKGLIIEVSQQDRKAGRPKFFHGWDEVLGKYFEMAHRERFDDQDRPYEIVGYQRRQT